MSVNLLSLDGHDAQRMLRKSKPDVVLLDIASAEKRSHQSTALKEHVAARLKQSLKDAHNLWEFADLIDRNRSEFLTDFMVVDSVKAVAVKSGNSE